MDQHSMKMVFIFTDGSAKNNGKRDCVAASAIWIQDYPQLCNAVNVDKFPSNQRAELLAIRMALQVAYEQFPDTDVTIVSDSMYSIDCLTKWYKNWLRNCWKTKDGKPVKHQDILAVCLDLIESHGKITFVHWRSHLMEPEDKTTLEWTLWYGNFMVDKLASQLSIKT